MDCLYRMVLATWLLAFTTVCWRNADVFGDSVLTWLGDLGELTSHNDEWSKDQDKGKM